jgi:hypothetical protein
MADALESSLSLDVSVGRFNRSCRWAAFLWLCLIVGASYALRPTAQDVPPYYMGGQIALRGLWPSLYPTPKPDARYNLGWVDQSTQQPEYAALAETLGVGAGTFRFIQLPPVAIAFVPLALFEYRTAIYLWAACLTMCAWGVAAMAGRGYARLAGRPTRLEGGIVLLVAMSPLVYRAIRVGNVSLVTALCFGWIALDLARTSPVRRSTVLGIAGLIVGFFTKYATPVTVPIYALLGRWRSLGLAAIFGVVVLVGTWLIAGSEPFVTFARDVAPSLSRSHPNRANQSLEGLLIRALGSDPPTSSIEVSLRLLQFLLLALILAVLWRARSRLARPANIAAAIVALIGWLLIFAPIYWDHYATYFMPFWGWADWQGTRSRGRAIAGYGAIALCWFPLSGVGRLVVPDPLTCPCLLAAGLFLGIALTQLTDPLEREPNVAGTGAAVADRESAG